MEELGGTTQTDHLDSRTSKTQVSGWPDRDREDLLENDQKPWFKWSNSFKKWTHFWLRVRNETEPLIWHIIYNCMNESITLQTYAFSCFHPLLYTISSHRELHSNLPEVMDDDHVFSFLTIPSNKKNDSFSRRSTRFFFFCRNLIEHTVSKSRAWTSFKVLDFDWPPKIKRILSS